jgi:(2Fe-2S) ferredoxin
MSESSNKFNQQKRIVICRGQYCNESRRADALLKILQPMIDEINGDQIPPPIKLETASCLSMCGGGPNLIVYPEGVVFNAVKQTDLEPIIKAHLKGD